MDLNMSAGGRNWFIPLVSSVLAGMATGLGAFVVVFLDTRGTWLIAC